MSPFELNMYTLFRSGFVIGAGLTGQTTKTLCSTFIGVNHMVSNRKSNPRLRGSQQPSKHPGLRGYMDISIQAPGSPHLCFRASYPKG